MNSAESKRERSGIIRGKFGAPDEWRQFFEVPLRFTAVEGGLDRLEAKIDHVDEKLGNFENREIDKRLQLEVRLERLEKQRS